MKKKEMKKNLRHNEINLHIQIVCANRWPYMHSQTNTDDQIIAWNEQSQN